MIRSYPSVYVLGFVVAGIVAADVFSLSPYLLLPIAAVFLGLGLWATWRVRHYTAAVAVGLALGFVAAFSFRMQVTGFGSNHIRQVVESPALYEVFGQVADWPEFRAGRTETVIEVDSLSWRNQFGWIGRRVEGRLLLKVTDTTTALQRGDRVAFGARLYPVISGGRNQFPYARYLNLRGIFTQAFLPTLLNVRIDRRPTVGFVAVIDRVRSTIRSSLERNLSPRSSALARGFLIGETRDIPPDIYGFFRDSGTLHLLAVSGSNVALIVLFAVWIMRPFWLSARSRSVVLVGVIAVFAGLSYGEPSVMRASLMAALIIGARLLGRTYDLNNIIAATALLILLIDPGQLFDVGFQLSFVTAWGLIFFVPRLSLFFAPWHERDWYRWLMLPVIVSLVAQVVSTPVVVYYFDRLPVLAIVANLLIVPIVSLAVIGVLILLAVDLIWPLLGSFFGSFVDLWMRGLVVVLEWLGGENMPILRPAVFANSPLAVPAILLFFILLIVLALAITNVRARRIGFLTTVVSVNLVLAVAVAATFAGEDDRVTMERVPGGLATIVWTGNPTKPDLVITGLSRQDYPLDERVLRPMLVRHGVRQLSRVMILSADYDALEDVLRLSKQMDVDTVFARRDLEGSIEDIKIRATDSTFVAPIVFFREPASYVDQPGYHLYSNGVSLQTGESRLDLFEQVIFQALSESPVPPGSTLVISSQWRPAPDDWVRLNQVGYDRIVCAKIELPLDSPWPDSELGFDALPDYLYDLSRTGTVTLPLGR